MVACESMHGKDTLEEKVMMWLRIPKPLES